MQILYELVTVIRERLSIGHWETGKTARARNFKSGDLPAYERKFFAGVRKTGSVQRGIELPLFFCILFFASVTAETGDFSFPKKSKFIYKRRFSS